MKIDALLRGGLAGYAGRATADGIAARRDAVLDRSRAQRQELPPHHADGSIAQFTTLERLWRIFRVGLGVVF